MESKEQEKISSKVVENKQYPMRSFGYLCKKMLLLCCKNCDKVLTTNAIIEKILRLKTGKFYFIIGDEGENSELFEKFKSLIVIQPELKINKNEDFQTVGINEVICKKCKSQIGVRMKQTDETQIFMLNKFVLNEKKLKYFSVEDMGLKPFHFYYDLEDLKKMDKLAIETEKYITESGNQIHKYFELLSDQIKNTKEIERKKNDIDKLGDILKYLIDKNYL